MAAKAGPHGGNSKAELTAFVALLLLASLAGWTWADAQTTPREGQRGARQTEQPAQTPRISPPSSVPIPAACRARERVLVAGGETVGRSPRHRTHRKRRASGPGRFTAP